MSLSTKIIIGVLVYLMFLVALIPAKVVLAFIPLADNVKVANINGSIWQGSVSSVEAEGKTFDQVRWDVNPWALLTGRASADIVIGSKATSFHTKGRISYSFSGLNISKLNLGTDADFLLAGQRLPFGTKAGGEVTVHVADFSQGEPLCDSLDGKVLLHHVNVKNQFGDFPLGELEFALACEQGEVVLTAAESGNKLGVSGQVHIGKGNRYKVDAKLRPTADMPEMIRSNLKYLGRPDSKGYYSIKYQGKLPV